MTNNLENSPEPSASPPENASGRNMGERMTALEVETKHLATKEDLQKQRVWIMGTVATGVFALIILGITLYFNLRT